MSVQQTFIFGWAGQGGSNPVSERVVADGDGEDNRSIALPGGGAVTVDLDWTADRLLGIYVQSPGTFTLVLNPNGSTPEEITPAEGVPIQWAAATGMYYPFDSATVEEIQLVSPQTDDQTVTIKTLQQSVLS